MNIPWKFKSTVFSAIDLLSADRALYFLQKNVTKRSRIKQLNIDNNWNLHLSMLKKYGATDVIFEFGAGKSLVQNLFLSKEVRKQFVVDLNLMIDIDLVETARTLLSTQVQLRSKKIIRSLIDLEEYGIEYRAPFDSAETGFTNESIDACISTNTLEHIRVDGIKEIFKELHRTLKSSGVVSAVIDYSDHYAYTDKSISLLNYLNFSDIEWGKYNHACHFQNRLRHYDYLKIFDDCGFKLVEESITYGEEDLPPNLIDKFRNMPNSWSATSAHMVLVKK